jgi:hypothetical protein
MKRSIGRGIAAMMGAIVLAGAASNPAEASMIHEVNMVKEGVDLQTIRVGANANGYTGHLDTTYTYRVRLFAKVNNGALNSIYWAEVTNDDSRGPTTAAGGARIVPAVHLA